MSNSKGEKSVSCHTRRSFLKWGALGVLVAGPIGIVAWRRSQKNKCRFGYILEGPFALEEGKGYAFYGDPNRWSGDKRNRMYTPKHVRLQVHGFYADGQFTEDADVSFTIVFDVAEDAPRELLALVKISFWSGGEVYTVKETEWGAPHKQPPKQTTTIGSQTPKFYTRPPEEYSLVSIPLTDLGRVDRICVDIEEIIRR